MRLPKGENGQLLKAAEDLGLTVKRGRRHYKVLDAEGRLVAVLGTHRGRTGGDSARRALRRLGVPGAIVAAALLVGCGGTSDRDTSLRIHDEFLACVAPYEASSDPADNLRYNACVRESVAKRRAAGLPR